MSGKQALEYLKDLCNDIDTGAIHSRLQKAACLLGIPAAALTLNTACLAVDEYGAPFFEDEALCSDAQDNNGDGATDCDDRTCSDLEPCQGGCTDGVDNDNNNLTDCDDPACERSEACLGCSDGQDNDGDGQSDCADPDCTGHQDCAQDSSG